MRKIIIIIFYLLAFQSNAQIKDNKTVTISPYKLRIEKPTNFKGIQFDKKMYTNGCAWINAKGYLILKDSTNFIHINSNNKKIIILSIFPNLYFIENNVNLYYINFQSKIISFYAKLINDPLDFPSMVDETNTTCENGLPQSSSNQYIVTLTNSESSKLIIEWDHAVSEGPAFVRSFHGYKIIDFDTFFCLFDEINIIEDSPSNSEEHFKCQRNISIKENNLIIGESELLTIKNINGKDQIIKRNNYANNNECLSIRKSGTYTFINGKFRLIQ